MEAKNFRIAITLIALVFTLAQQCFAVDPAVVLPDGARSWEKITGLKGLSNMGKVAPGLYRGAQPESDGYETLKKMGIKTVINLRTTHSEKLDVEKSGMRSVEMPMGVLSDVKPDIINKIVDIMNDPKKQPVFVHCRQGQDRTGIVIAAYRMRVEGWSLAEAEGEMQDYGFNDIWTELKEFVRDYAKDLGR